jgi:hypothetical protein
VKSIEGDNSKFSSYIFQGFLIEILFIEGISEHVTIYSGQLTSRQASELITSSNRHLGVWNQANATTWSIHLESVPIAMARFSPPGTITFTTPAGAKLLQDFHRRNG